MIARWNVSKTTLKVYVQTATFLTPPLKQLRLIEAIQVDKQGWPGHFPVSSDHAAEYCRSRRHAAASMSPQGPQWKSVCITIWTMHFIVESTLDLVLSDTSSLIRRTDYYYCYYYLPKFQIARLQQTQNSLARAVAKQLLLYPVTLLLFPLSSLP